MIHSTVVSLPEKGRAIPLFVSARRDGNTGELIDSVTASSGIDVNIQQYLFKTQSADKTEPMYES